MHIRLLEDDPALREALVAALSDCSVVGDARARTQESGERPSPATRL